MATLRQSFMSKISNASSIITLLPSGAAGVLVAGRVTSTTPTPCIAVRRLPISTPLSRRPYYDILMEVRVYDRPEARNAVDWNKLEGVLDACRLVLDGATDITAASENTFVSQVVWTNERSSDLFDPLAQMPYISDRYKAFCALMTHYHK